MYKANADIREYAKSKSVYLWQIAERYGLHEGNFSRLLRHPLPEEKREKVIGIINEIANEQQRQG